MHPDKKGIRSIIEELSRIEGFDASRLPPPPPPLPPSRDDGSSDGMEPRIAKLEAHMEQVRAELGKLGTVPAELATLTERVSHLPTKDWLTTRLQVYLGLMVAVSALGMALSKLL